MNAKRELLETLALLALTDRDAYRECRALAWEMVVENHQVKTPEQIDAWLKRAS